jgi:hypothetical protein
MYTATMSDVPLGRRTVTLTRSAARSGTSSSTADAGSEAGAHEP